MKDIFEELQKISNATMLDRFDYEENCIHKISRIHPGFWSYENLGRLKKYHFENHTNQSFVKRLGRTDFPTIIPLKSEDSFFSTINVELRAANEDLIHGQFSDNVCSTISETLDIIRCFEEIPNQYFSVSIETFGFEDIEGKSFTLALAIAAISAVRNISVSNRYVFTGKLNSNFGIVPVGEMEAKISLSERKRPLCSLFQPRDTISGKRSAQYETLSEIITLLFPEEDLIDLLRKEINSKNWEKNILIAEELQEQDLYMEDRLFVLMSLLQSYNHTNQEQQARTIASLLEVFDYSYCGIDEKNISLANISVHYTDILQPSPVIKILQTIEQAATHKNKEMIHLRGSLAKCLLDSGNTNAALEMYEKNLTITSPLKSRAHKEEYARCLADYADALRRAGKYQDAEKQFKKSIQFLNQTLINPQNRTMKPELRVTEGFALWQYGKLLIEIQRNTQLPEIDREHKQRDFFLASWELYKTNSQTSDQKIEYNIENLKKGLGLSGEDTLLVKMMRLRAKMLQNPSKENLDALQSLSPEYTGIPWDELKIRLPY